MTKIKSVPVVATEEMHEAGLKAIDESTSAFVDEVWEAMVKAAPGSNAEPVAWLYEMKEGQQLISWKRRTDDGTWKAEFPLIIQPF